MTTRPIVVTTSDYLKKKVRSRLAVSMNKRRERHRPCSFAAKKSEIFNFLLPRDQIDVIPNLDVDVN